jgi:hypothetical protein
MERDVVFSVRLNQSENQSFERRRKAQRRPIKRGAFARRLLAEPTVQLSWDLVDEMRAALNAVIQTQPEIDTTRLEDLFIAAFEAVSKT